MTKKAFVSWGGWEGHEPKATAKLAAAMLTQEGIDVTVSDSLEPFADNAFLEQMDLVVPVWTMSEIAPAQQAGLLRAVKKGAGCAGWHGGMGDAFRANTEFQFMTGGQFICHPGGIIDYTVNLSDIEDPITAGLSDFAVHSEQYYMHIDPAVEVLATTTFSGEHWRVDWVKDVVMPVAWKKRYGSGRVFYSALGHVASDFEVPEVTELLRRGCLWAMR
jgi:type 1 glutamine amidotransferase